MNKPNLVQILGANVAALRKARKLSQPKVAAMAKQAGEKIDQTTVGRVENGKYPATMETLGALGKAFQLEPWQLLMPDLDPLKPPKVTASGEISPEAKDIALAWMRLTPVRQHAIREWIFLESVLATHYPWLLPGRPSGQSYNDYEKGVENDLVRITKRLLMQENKKE